MLNNTNEFPFFNCQKAECSLKYYKGIKENNQRENIAICAELEKLKTITNKLKGDPSFQLVDICKYLNNFMNFQFNRCDKCLFDASLGNRNAMKGLAIGIAFTIFGQFTANFTLLNYAVMTFMKFGSTIDPHISSILLAVALILGSTSTTYLADRIGRKKLNLISLMGSACGLFATALFYYLNLNGFNLTSMAWIPVATLFFVVYISSAGIVSLQFVCSIENLPILVCSTTFFLTVTANALNHFKSRF